MRPLFGGFGGRCEAACREARPIPDATEAAVPFHPLPYRLVHLHSFGGSDLDGVRAALKRYGADGFWSTGSPARGVTG